MNTPGERLIKIKLLLEIEAELDRYHDTLKEGMDALKEAHIFYRHSDEMFLREMASVNLARLQLHKMLYPLYHEIQRESGLSYRDCIKQGLIGDTKKR